MIRNLNFFGLSVLLYWAAVSGIMLIFGIAMAWILLLLWQRVSEDKFLRITAYCGLSLLWLRLGYFCLFDVMRYQIKALITGVDVNVIFWEDFPQNILLFIIPGFIWLFLFTTNSLHVGKLIYYRQHESR